MSLEKTKKVVPFGTTFSILKLSSPEIALHKKSNVMQEKETEYVKRTQKDYSLSFKLCVVSEIERGEINIASAHRKYGIGKSYSSDVAQKIWYL